MLTRLGTSSRWMPRRPASASRSFRSASSRPESSWRPVPSVLPTSAMTDSARMVPLSSSASSSDMSDGLAIEQTCMSAR